MTEDANLDLLFPAMTEEAMKKRIDDLAMKLSEATEKNKKIESQLDMLKCLYFELLFTAKP